MSQVKNLDLQTALVNMINKKIDQHYFKYIKDHIYIQFLDKADNLGLVPTPGAHITDVDYSGMTRWVYNYVATIRTESRREAYNKLNELSNYLQSLNHSKNLISSNGSFKFDQIDVSSDVHEILENLKTVTYELDVAVYVYRKGDF